MDSKIGFEMSLIIVEAIRGRCVSFMILTATVSEIFGGQTNSSILVLYMKNGEIGDFLSHNFLDRRWSYECVLTPSVRCCRGRRQMNRSWVYSWNWSQRLTTVSNSRATVCGWSSLVSHAGPSNDGSYSSLLLLCASYMC